MPTTSSSCNFEVWQSQRDSNPCRHLESVIRHVWPVRVGTVLPGPDLLPIHSVYTVTPSISEKMDNRMDKLSCLHLSKVMTMSNGDQSCPSGASWG